jgi:hypothetical protein
MGVFGFFISFYLSMHLSMWWCLRQYYRARGKGYYPAPAATVVFGGMTVTFIAVIAGCVFLGSSTWSDTTVDMAMLLTFPVVALVMTALVALLPCRSRRAGARRSWFLSSRACRTLEVGLFVAGSAAIVPLIVILVALGGHAIGIWPKSELAEDLSGVVWVIWIFVIGAAALGFARERLGAPGLAETVATDTRPAVLYVRAFQQEFDPFTWVTPKERSRYTRRPPFSSAIVTFEQYLGAEFARQLGPFVALGNPLDSVPPEGAVRSYAPDEDWQRHFCALASAELRGGRDRCPHHASGAGRGNCRGGESCRTSWIGHRVVGEQCLQYGAPTGRYSTTDQLRWDFAGALLPAWMLRQRNGADINPPRPLG